MTTALPPVLILCGPTASGKSALAMELARRLGVGIVGVDSRQVYQGLTVATAAPSAEDLRQVPHHLVGHVSLVEDYTAGRFVRECRAALDLDRPDSEPRPWLLCGGSGFYLRALLDPVSPVLRADPALRRSLRERHAHMDGPTLRRELLALDPQAAWISPQDRAKLERYLEICVATGMPATRAQVELALPRPVHPFLVALNPGLSWLEERIQARSRRMLEQGMVREIRQALAMGVSQQSNALRSVGVAEVLDLLEGRLDESGCAMRLALSTRQLAKRQLTWLRAVAKREAVLTLPAHGAVDQLATRVVDAWRQFLKERP
jgi:tRNA dimethylallyltransferase